MGSKGSQTVTQSGQQNQQYTPNAPIGSMVQNAGQMATTAAGAPFQQPVAPVAPFNPFQGLGFGETLGVQGMAQPYFNTAGNYLAGSAAPITGSEVQNYLNPMTANVTAQLQNIFGQQNVQNTGNLVQSAGGVGADRIGVGQANMANQQTLAAGQVYSQLYQQALAAAQQNKQMQAGAGFAFGQMGPAAQAAQQNAINQLLGVGSQQQQLSQAQMNAIYQNQLAQIAYPFQTAQYLSGITAGLAPAMGGQTQGSYSGQTTYPAPSGFAQALGIGTGLLGMFGGMGGMGALGGAIGGLSGIQSAVPNMPFMGGGFMAPGTTYIGGNAYPMYDEGGAVDSNYGKLADKEYYQAEGPMLSAAARGNPIASEVAKDLGGVYSFDDGGRVIQVGDVVPFNQYHKPDITLREALERSANRMGAGAQGFAGAPADAVERAQDTGVLKIHPLHGFDDGGGIDPTLGQPAPMGLNLDPGNGLPYPGAGKVRGSPVPQMQLPTGQGGKSGLYGQQMIFHPPPSMPQSGGQQQGGLGQLAGSLGKSLGSLGGGNFGGLGSLGASADAGAGMDFLGGATDLGASIDEIGAMLPLALARRGGRIPRMAPGGIAPMGQPSTPTPPMAGPVPPSMTSPMAAMPPPGTGPQAFPPPGASAQPPPLSPTGVSMPPSVPPPGQMSPSTPPGGGVPPGTSPPNPLTPSLSPPGQTSPGMPPTAVGMPRQPGMPPPLSYSGTSPFSGPMPSRPPGMDTGGGLGGQPNGGRLAPNARRWQGFESRFPKDAPPMDWRVLPAVDKTGMFGQVAAGGVVDPMHPGQGYGDDDVDVEPPMQPTTESDKPTFGEMVGNTARQIGSGLSQYKRWMLDEPEPPPETAIVPPEAQSQYATEGHPRPAFDRPSEGTSMWDESRGYGPEHVPGVTEQQFPVPYAPGRDIVPRGDIASPLAPKPPSPEQATVQKPSPYTGLATMDQPFAVAANRGEQYGPPKPELATDPFGHGMANQDLPRMPGANGVIGNPQPVGQVQPGGLDFDRLRRTTRSMETWQPGVGDKRGDPYRNISPSQNSRGQYQEALGAYGIMNRNLPEWSRATLGREVSKEEFLSHPEIQDAIHDKYMGDLVRRFGIQGAGRAWLGGEGALNAPMRADPYGTRVGDYGNRFASNYERNIGAGAAQSMTSQGMRPSDNVEDVRNNVGMRSVGPMGSRNVPFPNATDPNNFARRMTSSPWMALMNAGARMAQTRGPIGSVIGAGLETGARTLEGQRAALDNEEAINQKAEHLALLADAHLRRYTQMTPHEQANLEEQRRYHDLITSNRDAGRLQAIRKGLEQEPMWLGRNDTDKDAEAVRRFNEEVQQGAKTRQGWVPGTKLPGQVPSGQGVTYNPETNIFTHPDGHKWDVQGNPISG